MLQRLPLGCENRIRASSFMGQYKEMNCNKYINKKINNAPVPHPAMRVVASHVEKR